jgi:hypothetical protein
MHSLFLKIFLWFWLSLILISLTMVIIAASKLQSAKGPT